MKKNTLSEFKSKSKEELHKLLLELREEVAKLLVERGSRKLKNVSLLREKKKDIARILTIIHQKELAQL